jgi:hypothetical protein
VSSSATAASATRVWHSFYHTLFGSVCVLVWGKKEEMSVSPKLYLRADFKYKMTLMPSWQIPVEMTWPLWETIAALMSFPELM